MLSVDHVLTTIRLGAKALPDNTLLKPPPLRYTFVEREDPHTFLLPWLIAAFSEY
eukprot:m.66326 g.66326  ORF g.66326 m.66326 type:complete len:55 (+) comp11798_c0_seq1:333-497(+)